MLTWAEGEIDGLEVTQALARFSGDTESYSEVVESYVRHTPALLAKVRSVTPETLGDYGIAMHGLKGSSHTLGAESVGNLAEALERAATAGDFIFVQTNNPLLLETAEKLLAALSAKLNVMMGRKVHRDKPAPEILEALYQACVTFDIDRMDQAMRLLTSYEYTQGEGTELVAWLEEKARRLDFKQIAERLMKNRPV